MHLLRLSCALVLISALAGASHHRSKHASGQAGVFDYYILTLSWSPEFCYGKTGNAECQGHQGFVVHGLWPENSNGTYPSYCQTSQPGPTDLSPVKSLIPGQIIEHEWKEHGTCSGLSGDSYFSLIRRAYDSVHIPPEFQAPARPFTIRASDLKKAFERANPGLADPEMVIQLRQGYLSAVKICLTKEEKPRLTACAGLRDAPNGTIRVPPVR